MTPELCRIRCIKELRNKQQSPTGHNSSGMPLLSLIEFSFELFLFLLNPSSFSFSSTPALSLSPQPHYFYKLSLHKLIHKLIKKGGKFQGLKLIVYLCMTGSFVICIHQLLLIHILSSYRQKVCFFQGLPSSSLKI